MTLPTPIKSYDAVIIGARCAGGATGMLLARAGANVLIVERDVELGDTLSTHAIMRPGVSLLSRWGLLGGLLDSTPAITQTQFQYGTEAINIPIKPVGDMPGLIAPRRYILDVKVIEAAIAAGADVMFGQSFWDISRNRSGEITGVILQGRDGTFQHIKTPMVIGADGRGSLVADKVRAETLAASTDRGAVVCAYLDGIPNKGYRWFYDEGRYGGIIPTSHGQSCVFSGGRPKDFKQNFAKGAALGMAEMFEGWGADVAEKLYAEDVVEKPRTFLGARGYMKQRAGHGWALIGDAAFFKDPASAHGISDAFMDAHLLVEALLSNPQNPLAYGVMRDAQSRPMFELTQKIAAFDWTLPQLKSLHSDLSACMKSEHDSLIDPQHAEAA